VFTHQKSQEATLAICSKQSTKNHDLNKHRTIWKTPINEPVDLAKKTTLYHKNGKKENVAGRTELCLGINRGRHNRKAGLAAASRGAGRADAERNKTRPDAGRRRVPTRRGRRHAYVGWEDGARPEKEKTAGAAWMEAGETAHSRGRRGATRARRRRGIRASAVEIVGVFLSWGSEGGDGLWFSREDKAPFF
jgi:hypothetical protein